MPPIAERTAKAHDASDENPFAKKWNASEDSFEEQFETNEGVVNTYDTADSNIEGLDIDEPATERAESKIGRILRAGAEKADGYSESLPELKDKAKAKLRGIGSAALSRLKNAGLISVGVGVMAGRAGTRGAKRVGDTLGDATIAGFKSVENGLDRAGKLVDTARENRQTRQFNKQMETDRKKSAKDYARQSEQLAKDRARKEKIFVKQDKRDIKQASRDLKDYTKILDKKDRQDARRESKSAAQERRVERRSRWTSSFNTLKSTAASGIDIVKSSPKRAGDVMMSGFAGLDKGMDWAGDKMVSIKESTMEVTERTRKKARIARVAGKMAIQTYRDTKQAFKNN